jgi:5-methylcytosine-specific restriction endonuclease McrA
MSQYERHSTITLEEVIPFVSTKENKLPAVKEIKGIKIKMTSDRYAVFSSKGCDCVQCGIKGVYFAIERTRGSKEGYHLNLYAVNSSGESILMTKDHIIPKSKGGLNRLDNYQPMCRICNSEKGSSIILSK